jgi:hypothetical protein
LASKTPSLIGLYSPTSKMGKSTISQFLVEGLGFSLVKFAGPVKAVTAAYLTEMGVPEDRLDDYLEGHLKEEGLGEFGFEQLTSRKIQQVTGTEAGRKALDPNFWTTLAARKVRRLLDQGKRVVMDDMRFPNEYDMIHLMGGEKWCVYNPRVEIPVSQHASEGQLDNHAFDQALINDTTIEALQLGVSALITRF